jgi:hypothetical protein
MMADDEIEPYTDRLPGDGVVELQAGAHPVDPLPTTAEKEADGVPRGRQTQRGEFFKRGRDGGERRHAPHHTISHPGSPSRHRYSP